MSLLPDMEPRSVGSSLAVELTDLVVEAHTRSTEFEADRQVAEDYYERLKASGVLRTLVPARLGGSGGTFLDWFQVVECLAWADASAGWVAAHGAITSSILGVVATPTLAAEFFVDSNATAAWSNLGSFECTVAPEGLLISGRWSFVTGCRFADYVGGLVKVPDRGAVSVLMPREMAIIEPNWNPIGLAGTGSHDVVVDAVCVPWTHIVNWPQPWSTEPAEGHDGYSRYRALARGTWPISLTCAATQLGLARRALDEIDTELQTRRDSYTNNKAASKPHLVVGLESAHAQLILCRNGFERILDKAWVQTQSCADLDKAMRTELRLGCIAITHSARDVVRIAFDAAGSSGLSCTNVFEKLYRDSSCLTSHVSASHSGFEVTSKARYQDDVGPWI